MDVSIEYKDYEKLVYFQAEKRRSKKSKHTLVYMKSILEKVIHLKHLAKNFIDANKDSISIIMRENFNRDFLLRIRKGEFLIPHDFIRYHIEEAVEKEADVELEDVCSTPEGILVKLIVVRYFAKVKINFCLSVKTVKVNSRRQIMIFRLNNEKIIGDNISGIIIASFTETILSGIITKAVFPEEILKSIHYKQDHTAAIVDLSEVDFIKSLNKPRLKTSKSLLDFISISGAQHTYNGIKLKIKAMSFLSKKR